MLTANPELAQKLGALIDPRRVLTRILDRVAYANDASYFHLIPQAVVQPASVEEIRRLFRFSDSEGMPMTFRAAGTSLSGQAVTDGILVDLARHWRRISVENEAQHVRVEPGLVGAYVNAVLKPYGRRIGPDPASIDACMMGGILANNSSGMCCGVTENAYRTVHSMTLVLPGGLVLDTGAPAAAEQLQSEAPEIGQGLLELKARLLADAQLAERVGRRYQMKNNNGYLLNAFLDFKTPLDILTHLMIGSEGTLGFIAEAVLRTLPEYPRRYTGQLYFASVQDAARAIAPLRDSGARAAEIMDRASLRSVENLAGAPRLLAQLPARAAAILVEYQGGSADDLGVFRRSAAQACREIALIHDPEFTEDPAAQAALWKLRKGMIPSVGAMRRPGTTVLIEDVVFPVPRLADGITDLQNLFAEHGYQDAIVFGHAKDGNLHFVMSQSFNTPDDVCCFETFTGDLVRLVSGKYDGALKAEHGTGRNMAPFIETEWGANAYGIMRDLKALLDPAGVLSPGVLINDDPKAHISHLKTLPAAEQEIDQCIECGFCEARCPSRRLTLTPRQRIVVRREIARQRCAPDSTCLHALIADYEYAGVDTCAADGLCSTSCPVGINTGELTKRLRADKISHRSARIALWLSRHYAAIEGVLRLLIRSGHLAAALFGSGAIRSLTRSAERVMGRRMPKWNDAMPGVPSRRHVTERAGAGYVYFPSCLSRVMGVPASGAVSLADTLVTVALRGGINVWIPEDVAGACCGMPFGSHGYEAAYRDTLHRTLARMWAWTEQGRLPVVIDTTSCAYTLRTCADALAPEDLALFRRLLLFDSIEFLHDVLMPRLKINVLPDRVVLHPNCSAQKLNLSDKLVAVARRCAQSVQVPISLDCCGFAGDRGLLFPELTASATELEAAEVAASSYDGYYSSNIPCEMGMTEATGRNYRSILYLVEKATRM